MASLSPASLPVSSSHAAEALLSRARRLSHNAYNEYERSRPTLTAFAEGEELILPSSSAFTPSSPSASISATGVKLPSPSLSPTSCLTTATLHQKHRESFNGIVREHSRKRSSAQRLSSASTTSSSSSSSTSSTKISSPASTLLDPSTSSSATSSPVTMMITSSSGASKQQAGQDPRGDQGDQKQEQEQDQQQQQDEGAEGRQQEQPQPQPLPLTPSSSVSLSSSPNNASLSTNTTASNRSSAQTSTPSPSSCSIITQTTTTTISDPSMTRRSLTIVTRPRALTLESIRELRESSEHNPLSPPATSGNTTTLAPLDQHRKHRSDLGNSASLGLVRGVMEALRDNEQQSHTKARSTPGWALSLPEATCTPTPTPSTAFSQADLGLDVKMTMNRDQVVENKAATTTPAAPSSFPSSLPDQQNPVSPIHSAIPASTPINNIHPMAPFPQVPEAINTTLADLSLTSPPPPSKPALDRAFTGSSSPPKSSPLRRTSMTPSPPSDTNGDSKGALLSSSPLPPAAGVAAVTAASSSPTTAKSGRRSSKLFGKLVPKFLQTSFGPNNPSGGSGLSPRSAVPISPSPLSAMARPIRSASFTSGYTVPTSIATAAVVAGAASGSVGMRGGNNSKGDALPQLPELPALSTSVLSSNEDWLGMNGANKESNNNYRRTPSSVLSASPIAAVAVETTQQPLTVTSQFNMSIDAIEEKEEPLHYSHSSTYEFKVYEHETEQSLPTMPQEFHKQDPFHNHNMQEDNGDNHHKDGSGSPYIIDENCDDDFFLNSVLRKKSTNSNNRDSTSSSSSSSPSSTRPHPPPLLSAGSWRGLGIGTTPSLSATSSQASSVAPSPTSPYPSSSTYTPTPTPVSATATTPLPYRSSNGSGNLGTMQMTQSGLDEKRSRLRDAVGEWRRSANASINSSDMESTPSPISTSYSGFAL
ncbi:hypothetical protein BGZ47_005419 [Haplosporangium gracile]|nr:hypothetical protein BGZ47_005419 [Haplosporangium gracile]